MTKNSIDILKEIVNNNKEIYSLLFLEFGSYDLIQDRINLNSSTSLAFTEAMQIRDTYNLPFWDSFNLSLFGKSFDDFSFFNEIKFHNNSTKRIVVNRNDFLNEYIEFKNYTTFCSLVNNNESNTHIPLFDFHIPVSSNNEKICMYIIKTLELTGYLLDSGKSYHFIGDKIITENEMHKILHYALLYAPIVDKSWIAHQLIQNYCCLRITEKYNRLPILVDRII